MSGLFEVKQVDQDFYRNKLQGFLPENMIDIHTHVWRESFRAKDNNAPNRTVGWPSMVAADNPAEDLLETYRLMFPDKKVNALIFGFPSQEYDIGQSNSYVMECSRKYGLPSLYLAHPGMSAPELEKGIEEGGFLGCKVYLNFAPNYIPENEIRIFDFLPEHQLKVLDKRGWIVMLHIPRGGRLKDEVNLVQMLEIEKKYPGVKLIIAHVGRAYCDEDLGNTMDILSQTKNMMFDFAANSNSYVFSKLIEAVGTKRIMFGSDLPILRMRAGRVCENGKYYNLVPRGLYGDVSSDSHMREVDGDEAKSLTFFMYEEIDAFRLASEAARLKKEDIEDVFYNNAARLLKLKQEK